jgi:antitoxin component of MazEF toxin-antitoxin module
MTRRNVYFKSVMTKTGANTTGVVIPPRVMSDLGGGARPAVEVTINDYTFRTTVGAMKGLAMIPFSAQHRAASGIAGGDRIEVQLAIDTQPRTTKVPKDLAKSLAEEPELFALFEKLAPSRRKADIENVESAKAPETRARRIASILSRLRK